MPQRNLAALGQMGEQQGGDLGNIVGMSGDLRQRHPDFTQPVNQQDPSRHRRGLSLGGSKQRPTADYVYRVVQARRQIHLLQFAELREIGDEDDATAGILQHFLRQGRTRSR
jgi:hypothetical protein